MVAKCYIIPDVHGRDFWKKVRDICPTETPVVFLGDYLDPYGFEGITPSMAIDMFAEVIEFKKANPNVVLLLGNHDCTYVFGKNICNCRCNNKDYNKIKQMFKDNIDLFGISYQISVGEKKFLLSHAGVNPKWLENNEYTVDDIPKFNEYIKEDNGQYSRFVKSLGDVSRFRGGWNRSGSVVWADIREYLDTDLSVFDFEQVVGHTYIEQPVILEHISCIDVQRVFCIDENGSLCEYEFEKL